MGMMGKTTEAALFCAILLMLGMLMFGCAQPQGAAASATPAPASDAQASPAAMVGAVVATPAAQVASSASVAIKDFAFDPAQVTVRVGAAVTWKNEDPMPHQVVSDALPALKSPAMPQGSTYGFMFDKTGTYEYYCAIHPSMKGTVVVVAG